MGCLGSRPAWNARPKDSKVGISHIQLAQQGGRLCHRRWIPAMVTAWLHGGRVMFLWKLGRTATAKALLLDNSS